MTPLAWVTERLVRGYQLVLRPVLPAACRFAPSCSEYARIALIEHGFLRGLWLAVERIARCHPFHPGGYDPPPPRRLITKRQGR
jgi:uncharacterized protein